MHKTSLLLMICLISLPACTSTSLVAAPCPEQPKPAQIQTEAPGYFQQEWMQLLQNFRKGLVDSSKGATN